MLGKPNRPNPAVAEAKQTGGISRRKAIFLSLILLGLPLLWRWTPLYDSFNLETILAWQESVKNDAAAPLYVAAAYLIGSLCFFPITILNLATVFAFGPLWGNIYALSGWLLSSAEGYGIGRLIGKDLLHKLAGRRLAPLVDRIEQHESDGQYGGDGDSFSKFSAGNNATLYRQEPGRDAAFGEIFCRRDSFD